MEAGPGQQLEGLRNTTDTGTGQVGEGVEGGGGYQAWRIVEGPESGRRHPTEYPHYYTCRGHEHHKAYQLHRHCFFFRWVHTCSA